MAITVGASVLLLAGVMVLIPFGLRAGDQPGETQTFAVPAGSHVGRRAELVAVIRQPKRLRTLHRLVVLAQPSGAGPGRPRARSARPPRVRQGPACGERNRSHEQDRRPGADRECHQMR